MLRDQGAERFVDLREAIATLVKQGRPEVTVRSWLKPPRRHTEDRCRTCRRTWPPAAHKTCPGPIGDTGHVCGGALRQVRRGNANDVIEGYCDIATHRVLVWWPDMWRKHLVSKYKAERAAVRRSALKAAAEATRDEDSA